jgi:lipopolysaccharide export system protein LptA
MTARGNVRLQLSSKPKGTNAPIQITATAEQAVYTGTNELFVLTGQPRVVSAYGTLTGTTIRYDVATSRASAEDYRFTPDPRMLTNLLERARFKAAPGRTESK